MVYPLLWWSAILVLDAVNFKKWGASPMRTEPKFFLGLILPLSAIYWLFFELVNFAFPQWYYVGVLEQPLLATILTFVSFATVIPAVVELAWLFAGRAPAIGIGGRWSWASVAAGVIFAFLPFFSNNFWLNQAVWFAPFLLIAPLLGQKAENLKTAFIVGAAGLASGILWEFFNSFASIKWKYGILLAQPHLFEMPLLGYLGFVPFAFSTLAVYLLAKEFLKTRWWLVGPLYAIAFLLSYIFILSV